MRAKVNRVPSNDATAAGWRIQLMVRLGREVQELPAEVLFSDMELCVLATFAHSRSLAPPRTLVKRSNCSVASAGGLDVDVPPRRTAPVARLYSTRGHDLAFELRDKYG